MSFRELRNLTEMMRALGYPRPISVENFRKPNFELVSDLLYWMVKKYDPTSSVTEDIDTEDDRIHFLTQIAGEVLVKARLKLNPKKLYAADGFAVKELIRFATVLYDASRITCNGDSAAENAGGAGAGANGSPDDEDETQVSAKTLLGARLRDPNATRLLSSDITQSGAKLFELLDTEMDVREQRSQALRFLEALSSNSEHSNEQRYLERSLQELVQGLQDNVEATERQCVELEAEEKALATKIKKAQTDLERSEKRLKSLQYVRPAFMDEYEKLEKELERQYAIYCERFRNLDYLQRELDLHNARETKQLAENERSLKKLQKKFREDELAILRGEQEDQLEGGDNDNNNNGRSKPSSSSNNNSSSAAKRNQGGSGAKTKAGKAGDSGSEDDSASGDDDDDATSDEETGAAVSANANGNANADADTDSDEVSLADSGEGIENDDASDSGQSDGSKSGSAHSHSGSGSGSASGSGSGSGSGSESNSDSEDF